MRSAFRKSTAVVKALTTYKGMSEDDARKMVGEWIASYNTLKAQLASAKAIAEQKARVAADNAAKDLACSATVTFFAFLIVTVCGGICGAKRTFRHTTFGMVSP